MSTKKTTKKQATKKKPAEETPVESAITAPESEISAIIASRVTHTPTGLIYDEKTTFEEWLSTYNFYTSLGEKTKWMIGDCLRAGERFGDRYAQAVHIEDKSYSYLTTIVSVCGRFADQSRRREDCPFSWHEAVAYLPPQTADTILSDAVKKKWNRDEIRDAAAIAQGLPTKAQKEAVKEAKKVNKVTVTPVQSAQNSATPNPDEPAATTVIDGQFEMVPKENQSGLPLPPEPDATPEQLLARFVESIPRIDVPNLTPLAKKLWLHLLTEVDKLIDQLQSV